MFLPLTPIRFLLWAADEYGEKVGVVDGDKRFTYRQVSPATTRMASAIQAMIENACHGTPGFGMYGSDSILGSNVSPAVAMSFFPFSPGF